MKAGKRGTSSIRLNRKTSLLSAISREAGAKHVESNRTGVLDYLRKLSNDSSAFYTYAHGREKSGSGVFAVEIGAAPLGYSCRGEPCGKSGPIKAMYSSLAVRSHAELAVLRAINTSKPISKGTTIHGDTVYRMASPAPAHEMTARQKNIANHLP